MRYSFYFPLVQAQGALKQRLAVARRTCPRYAGALRELRLKHTQSCYRGFNRALGIIGVIRKKQLSLRAYKRKLSGCAACVYA